MSQRGFAELLLSQGEDDRDKLPSLLKDAISDLREGAKLGLGGAALSQALLSFSYSIRRENPTEALGPLSEAKRATSLIADPALLERLRSQISYNEIAVRISLCIEKEDIQNIASLCHQLFSFGDDIASLFALGLVRAARLLLRGGNRDVAPGIGLKTVSLIERLLSSGELDDASRGQYSLVSNAASFLRLLGDEHYERSYDLYREIIAKLPDEILRPTFTFAADVALHLGKYAARLGNPIAATNFFLDSVEWYEKGIASFTTNPEEVFEGFMPVVCYSKAGEAYVRLQAVQPTAEYSQLAIKYLETARSLGNGTPELLGILGDAYYRYGLYHRDGLALGRALELKAEARAAGHISRENWSVSASISRKMHFYDGDPKWNVQAIHAAVEAHHADPTWPWPLFQIAEFMERSHAPAVAALIEVASRPTLSDLKEKIVRHARSTIERDAVELAIASVEFKKLILGGRTRVYVLDDPHGLISTTVVLKPTTSENANREVSALRSFGEFLKSTGRAGGFLLPRAIAIIDQDENRSIYG